MNGIFAKMWGKLKSFLKEIAYFLTSKIFLKNFAGVVLFIVAILFLTSWWLRCYTNHGESLQVHDYIDLPLADAIKKAESRSFSIIISDSLYLVGKPANIVIKQNPKPLSRVKENRKIYLTITSSQGDPVILPNLSGGNDAFDQYKKKLKRVSVSAKITGRRFNNKLAENTILEVIYEKDTITNQLDQGYKVYPGSVIKFIVSERGGGHVPIPNLVCQKYDAAKFLVGNYNLNIGSVIQDNTITNRQTAYVWKQRPSFDEDAIMRVGEQIDIYITQYRPDNCPKEVEIDFPRDNIESGSNQTQDSLEDTNSPEETPINSVIEEGEDQNNSTEEEVIPTREEGNGNGFEEEEEEEFGDDGDK